MGVEQAEQAAEGGGSTGGCSRHSIGAHGLCLMLQDRNKEQLVVVVEVWRGYRQASLGQLCVCVRLREGMRVKRRWRMRQVCTDHDSHQHVGSSLMKKMEGEEEVQMLTLKNHSTILWRTEETRRRGRGREDRVIYDTRQPDRTVDLLLVVPLLRNDVNVVVVNVVILSKLHIVVKKEQT